MEDPQRCRAAGIPPEADFATRPRQAQAMIGRAIAAGVPFATLSMLALAWLAASRAQAQKKGSALTTPA